MIGNEFTRITLPLNPASESRMEVEKLLQQNSFLKVAYLGTQLSVTVSLLRAMYNST